MGPTGLRGQGAAALIQVVLRNRLGFGGIEPWGLVEVVGGGFLGGLLLFPTGPISAQDLRHTVSEQPNRNLTHPLGVGNGVQRVPGGPQTPVQ